MGGGAKTEPAPELSGGHAKCPHLDAFLWGASACLPEGNYDPFRKQIDRQIQAAPSRACIGARWAAFLSLTTLIELKDADPRDLVAAFPPDEQPFNSLGAPLEVTQARRKLAAARRSRLSRERA